VLHFALWFPVTALGIYYMVREGINWKDVTKSKAQPTLDEGIQNK
jgi:hypothetical protein